MPMALTSSESGMTSVAISAARQLPSNRNNTAITSSAPSARLRVTVPMVAATSWERSSRIVPVTPSGSAGAIMRSLSPTALATVRLFSPTSISALPTTISWPLRLAAPDRSSPPTFTMATSRTITGTPPRAAITALEISSIERMRASARTRYDSPERWMKLAPTERLALSSAWARSV